MDSTISPFLRALVAGLFKRSRDLDVASHLGHPSVDQFCIFCLVFGPLPSICMPNLTFVTAAVLEILRGS